MDNQYVTVWQVSQFSNGHLLFSVAWLLGGVYWLIFRRPKKTSHIVDKAFYFLALPFWFWLGMQQLSSALRKGRELPAALNQQRCEIVAGTVSLLHKQAYGGHEHGDLIQIGKKQFEVDYFSGGFGYRLTVSRGGCLTNGASARLHYVGNTILKVEIKQ